MLETVGISTNDKKERRKIMAINMPSDVFPSGKLRLKCLLHDFSEIIFICS